jgi:hypothetical protein
MESSPNTDWLDTLQKVAALAVAAATVYAYMAQADAMKSESENHRAQALLGASKFYGKIASFFGRQAMRTEQAYWKAVNHV